MKNDVETMSSDKFLTGSTDTRKQERKVLLCIKNFRNYPLHGISHTDAYKLLWSITYSTFTSLFFQRIFATP